MNIDDEFDLALNEIPYFTHEFESSIRNAKLSEQDKDLDEDEDEDFDDSDEDDDESEDEEPGPTLIPSDNRSKIIFLIVGAIVLTFGTLAGYLLRRPSSSHTTDEMLKMSMIMLMHSMMRNIQMHESDHHEKHNHNEGEFKKEEDIGAKHSHILPSREEFLEHVRKFGPERIPSQDLTPNDFVYRLPPYRKHEIWKVVKNLSGDIHEAYRTHEYMK